MERQGILQTIKKSTHTYIHTHTTTHHRFKQRLYIEKQQKSHQVRINFYTFLCCIFVKC